MLVRQYHHNTKKKHWNTQQRQANNSRCSLDLCRPKVLCSLEWRDEMTVYFK